MAIIKAIIATDPPAPTSTPFTFDMSENAAQRNAKILEEHDYDMTKVINEFQDSHIGYGSEFRAPSILEPLLIRSPFWPEVKKSLTSGAKYPLTRINNRQRIADLHDAIRRGNHKSAKENNSILSNIVSNEVSCGFQLPTTVDSLFHIPHTVIAPYGLVSQQSINEHGEIIEKFRNTHDQSFKYSSGKSVNDRVKQEELTDLFYGDALLRTLHYIHNLRFHHPSTPILIGKYDFKSAYRRLTTWGHTSAASTTIIDGIAYISLRLTFGGSPCPPLWCSISELITDLANDILECKEWDPSSTHSPHHTKVPSPKLLMATEAFGKARPSDVNIPLRTCGKVDCFIDDLIQVALEKK